MIVIVIHHDADCVAWVMAGTRIEDKISERGGQCMAMADQCVAAVWRWT